ncbi:NAD kinase [Erysipelothrix urinaevulpis]|uniref:NAD kinase n=1 Tax=Erysipelothrix urinaevulpis TaxID=2683717 RepID=UPI001358DF14|nr:NAD kinase [Erysipelothrix urinaevulpis]
MRKFTLVNRGDENSQRICSEIKDKLIRAGFVMDQENPELIVYVGGDGTLLHAMHEWVDDLDHVYFTGIHTGTLGFSTDYTADEIDVFIEDISTKKAVIEEKRILQANCVNDTKELTIHALNEIRVENIVKTQEMDVYINDSYFETFRGNGMCISGQYGSTAYNRSIGGAVIYPGLDLLQMTEISGIHHRHARSLGAPLILNPDAKITFNHDDFAHALLCFDHLHIHLDGYHQIEVSSYSKTMKFAHFNKKTHLERLNALF